MKLSRAQRIAFLYEELIAAIPRDKLSPPKQHSFSTVPFKPHAITIEDGMVKVEWSKYVGCGEYENATTYLNLSDVFGEV